MNKPNAKKDYLRRIKNTARTFLARGTIHGIDFSQSAIDPKNYYNVVFIIAFFQSLVVDRAVWLNLSKMVMDFYSTHSHLRNVILPQYMQFTGGNYATLEKLRAVLPEKEADCFMKIFYIGFIAERNRLIESDMRRQIEKFVFAVLELK